MSECKMCTTVAQLGVPIQQHTHTFGEVPAIDRKRKSDRCRTLEICGDANINNSTTYTPVWHVVRMLERDQRTAKVPAFRKKCALECNDLRNSTAAAEQLFCEKRRGHRFPGKAVSAPPTILSTATAVAAATSTRSRAWKTIERLKRFLVVGTYLLNILTIPCSSSAPTLSTMDKVPRWIIEYPEIDQNTTPQPVSQLVVVINTQANITLGKATSFKENYAEKVHGKDSITLDKLYRDQHYDWLPSNRDIPINLGEKVSQANLEILQFDTVLPELYKSLQRVACGMEEVILDQRRNNSPFLKNFEETYGLLISLIVEMHGAIVERNLSRKEDFTREEMVSGRGLRDESSRIIRDWVIYRDCIRTVDYVQQVVSYLKDHL